MDEYEQVLTPVELAEVLRICMNRVYELLNNKEILAYREGRNWRIPYTSVAEYMNRRCSEDKWA